MTQQTEKKGIRQKIAERISPPKPIDRIKQADAVLRDYGFVPVFEMKTTEQRRTEISKAFSDLLKTEMKIYSTKKLDTREALMQKAKFQAQKLSMLFYLFFQTGSPWVRGLDNGELSNAVSCYIMNYEDFGHLPSALPDLHAESMQLLHLSWQGVDVTQMPDYIIQVMQPQYGYKGMMPTSGGAVSETYQQVRKPKGGPYDEQISNDIR